MSRLGWVKGVFTIRDPRRFLTEIAIFMFFVALSVAMTWPFLAKAADHTTNIGVGDPLANARFLRVAYDWLFGMRANLFDADLFFPHPNVFGTTDPCFGVALLALPFRAFTDNYFLLVNIAVFLTFPLTAHGTYLLVRNLTGSRAAGVISGCAFAFCMYRFHQLDHAGIMQMQWLPYSLAYLHRLRDKPSFRNGALFTLFLGLNGFASVHVGVYSVPAYAIAAVYCIATVKREVRVRFLAALGGATVAAVILLSPVINSFLSAQEVYRLNWPSGEVSYYSARIVQFAAAPAYNRLWGPLLSKNLGSESATFLGFTVLVLALVAMAFPRAPGFFEAAIELAKKRWLGVSKRLLKTLVVCVTVPLLAYASLFSAWAIVGLAALAVGAVALRLHRSRRSGHAQLFWSTPVGLYLIIGVSFAVLSMGPEILHGGKNLGAGVWKWVAGIPPFGNIRTPSRIFLVTSLSFAVIAGFGVRAVLATVSARPVRQVVFAMLLLGVIAEAWSAPLPMRREPRIHEAPPVYHWLAAQPGKGAVVELPWNQHLERPRMYFANLHKRPTSDAEASYRMPVIDWLLDGKFASGEAAINLERLSAAGLEYVVLHRAYVPPPVQQIHFREYAKVGARKAAEFGTDIVFQMPRPEQPPAPFTRENVDARIEVAPSVGVGAEVSVTVRLSPNGRRAIYTPGVSKLALKMTAEGENGSRLSGERAFYLAPALVAPASDEVLVTSFRFAKERGNYRAMFRLDDGRDGAWAELKTTIAVAEPIVWQNTARSLQPSPCAVRVVSSHRLPDQSTRVYVVVSNASETAWAGAAQPSLQVAEWGAPEIGQPLRRSTARIPELANGAATGIHRTFPSDTQRVSFDVVFPGQPAAQCAALETLGR